LIDPKSAHIEVKGCRHHWGIPEPCFAEVTKPAKRLKTAQFLLKNGPAVLIPAAELRRGLEGGDSHCFDNEIRRPFNINPEERTAEKCEWSFLQQIRALPPPSARLTKP